MSFGYLALFELLRASIVVPSRWGLAKLLIRFHPDLRGWTPGSALIERNKEALARVGLRIMSLVGGLGIKRNSTAVASRRGGVGNRYPRRASERRWTGGGCAPRWAMMARQEGLDADDDDASV